MREYYEQLYTNRLTDIENKVVITSKEREGGAR